MSRHARQMQAAQRAHDDAYPYDDRAEAQAEREAEEAEREEERREEFISAVRKELVADRMRDEDHTVEPFRFLTHDQEVSLLEAAGRFVAAFERANTNDEMAEAGYVLFRVLRPYAEDYITEIARQDAADKYDADQRIPWHQKRAVA